jgi:uncharacterized protein (TIGR00725 family)
MSRKPIIGVIGGSTCSEQTEQLAHEVGQLIAQKEAVLVCGGKGGIMEAASKGASEHGGIVLGILPGDDASEANAFVSVAIPTGMGIGRNILIVRTADVLIAFPGSYGTLSEIALALNIGKCVVCLPGVWDLRSIGKIDSGLFKEAFDAGQAVGIALNSVVVN